MKFFHYEEVAISSNFSSCILSCKGMKPFLNCKLILANFLIKNKRDCLKREDLKFVSEM